MAKRFSARRPSKRAPPVTGDDRIHGLLRKFRAIAEDHRASGGSAAELAEALGRLGNGDFAPDDGFPPHMETLQTIADLLELWYSDATWLHGGQPRALKPTGRYGFAGLCRALGVAKEASSLLSLGLAVGSLKKTAKGDLLPVDRTALVKRPSPMVLDLMSVGLAAWQSTVRHNVLRKTTDATRRLDRGIYHASIPAAAEPEYHRMARAAGKQFLDRLDNWLLAHRADASARDARLVCAHVFAGTHASPRARRSGKKRREQR
jgi:uncharacterized protein DUF6502